MSVNDRIENGIALLLASGGGSCPCCLDGSIAIIRVVVRLNDSSVAFVVVVYECGTCEFSWETSYSLRDLLNVTEDGGLRNYKGLPF